MKHSPGTWEAEFVGHGGPGDNPVEVWEVNNGHARIAEYMTEADARLIAAAPELLAALRDVAALLPVSARLHPDDLTALQSRICAAIAKVEG